MHVFFYSDFRNFTSGIGPVDIFADFHTRIFIIIVEDWDEDSSTGHSKLLCIHTVQSLRRGEILSVYTTRSRKYKMMDSLHNIILYTWEKKKYGYLFV